MFLFHEYPVCVQYKATPIASRDGKPSIDIDPPQKWQVDNDEYRRARSEVCDCGNTTVGRLHIVDLVLLVFGVVLLLGSIAESHKWINFRGTEHHDRANGSTHITIMDPDKPSDDDWPSP